MLCIFILVTSVVVLFVRISDWYCFSDLFFSFFYFPSSVRYGSRLFISFHSLFLLALFLWSSPSLFSVAARDSSSLLLKHKCTVHTLDPTFLLVRLFFPGSFLFLVFEWMNGVLGHDSGMETTWANEMNHAAGAESITQPVGQQSSALSLYHGCLMFLVFHLYDVMFFVKSGSPFMLQTL